MEGDRGRALQFGAQVRPTPVDQLEEVRSAALSSRRCQLIFPPRSDLGGPLPAGTDFAPRCCRSDFCAYSRKVAV